MKQFLSRSAKSRLHLAVSGVKFMAPFWESAIRVWRPLSSSVLLSRIELFSVAFARYDKCCTKTPRVKFELKGLLFLSVS